MVGRFLGSRYELLEPVGRGAMGEVWRARVRPDAPGLTAGTDLPGALAVKLLRQDLAGDPDVVRRFVQERSLLMGLAHPGIVRVIDMVAEGDSLGIVMELVPGGTLAEALKKEGTLPPSVAVPVVCGVLDALAYAHKRGVLHRDVKPANVLLGAGGLDETGGAKLGDFGIASFVDERGVHATGLVGSPAYMPPELFTSGTVTAASDVYAAGVMLYELLAGRTPFAGAGNAHTVGFRHVSAEPPALPVDPKLWSIVEMMLSKNPAGRPSAGGAAEALRALPPETLTANHLPVQDEPEWDAGATIIPRRATAQRSDAADSGGVGATDGQADDEGAEPDIGETALGGPVHPVARPAPVSAAPTQKRPRWLLPVVVVACVALIGGGVGVAVKAGALKPGEVSVSTTPLAPAHLTGRTSPAGLRLDLDAATGTDPGSVALTITLAGSRTIGLSGDVLIVIPPADSAGKCPVFQSPDLAPASQSVDGVAQACAYKTPVTLKADATSTIKLQVSGYSGSDLSSWLGSIEGQTNTALSQVTGAGFGLQRVTGLRVQADSIVRTEASPQVQYRVFATWSGGEQELFRNTTLAYQATDLLKALTGGAGLSAVKVTSCAQTQVQGTTVLALQPANSCFVQVSIGDLASQPASFAISTSGS